MPCHVPKSRSPSPRRHHQPAPRRSPPLSALAVLDLAKPAERAAHDFLLRATTKPDRFWRVLDIRRQEGALLCVVRWVHPDDPAKPFALAQVSLTERAVFWRDYVTADAARAELQQRYAATVQQDEPARAEADGCG